MTYALSDSRDSSLRQRCQHVHEEHCSECDSMNSVLNEICEFVEWDSFPSKDDSDEAQYLAQHSRDTILAWKAHQLRTVRQDKARLEILENLDYGSVSNTGLGHEISTQKVPRVTVRLVRQKGNFLAHIRCRPPPQQPVGVSGICAYYPELHPRKFSCRRNYGTRSKRLENRTPGDTESILSPR